VLALALAARNERVAAARSLPDRSHHRNRLGRNGWSGAFLARLGAPPDWVVRAALDCVWLSRHSLKPSPALSSPLQSLSKQPSQQQSLSAPSSKSRSQSTDRSHRLSSKSCVNLQSRKFVSLRPLSPLPPLLQSASMSSSSSSSSSGGAFVALPLHQPVVPFNEVLKQRAQSLSGKAAVSQFARTNDAVVSAVITSISKGPVASESALISEVSLPKAPLGAFCMAVKARFAHVRSHPLYHNEFSKKKTNDLPRFLWASSTCEHKTLLNGILESGLAWCYSLWHYTLFNEETCSSVGPVEACIVSALMDLALVQMMAPRSMLVGASAAEEKALQAYEAQEEHLYHGRVEYYKEKFAGRAALPSGGPSAAAQKKRQSLQAHFPASSQKASPSGSFNSKVYLEESQAYMSPYMSPPVASPYHTGRAAPGAPLRVASSSSSSAHEPVMSAALFDSQLKDAMDHESFDIKQQFAKGQHYQRFQAERASLAREVAEAGRVLAQVQQAQQQQAQQQQAQYAQQQALNEERAYQERLRLHQEREEAAQLEAQYAQQQALNEERAHQERLRLHQEREEAAQLEAAQLEAAQLEARRLQQAERDAQQQQEEDHAAFIEEQRAYYAQKAEDAAAPGGASVPSSALAAAPHAPASSMAAAASLNVPVDTRANEYALVTGWASQQSKVTVHDLQSEEHKDGLCRAIAASTGADCKHNHQPTYGGLCSTHYSLLKKEAQKAAAAARRRA
jgi:hypothetical protein